MNEKSEGSLDRYSVEKGAAAGRDRHEPTELHRRQQTVTRSDWLAIATATAVLFAGLNGFVQIVKVAIEVSVDHRWQGDRNTAGHTASGQR